MRVMKIGGQTFGISAEQEAEWPIMASEALRAVRDGERQVPTVWYRTDLGSIGTLPISDRFPVTFLDEETSVNLSGTVTLLGRAAEPPDAYNGQ